MPYSQDNTANKPILIAEARVARQRELVALLQARGADVSEAKSVLSALIYSLRVLKRRQQSQSLNRTSINRRIAFR